MAADDQQSPPGTSEPLTLRLLGAPQISCGGNALQTDTKKAIALLAYLGMQPGEHERNALASLLWTSDDTARNKAALRRTLSTTQKALAALDTSPLVTTRKTIAAPTETWVVDALQLQEQLDHPPESPPPQACIEEAIALYQGPFLAGFTLQEGTPFETWCQQQSQALQRTYLQGLSWLMEGYEAAQEWTQAIPLALRWLEFDPLEESIHQKLIRWYIEDGQRDAALQQYEACQEQLSEGLGTKPSPTTRQLLTLLQNAAPTTSSPDVSTMEPEPSSAHQTQEKSAPPSASSTAPLQPLLGREKEVAEILELFADPQCRWLTIKGPFGAGTSHLARHVTEELGGHVLSLNAREYNTSAALLQAVSAVDSPLEERWLLLDQVTEASAVGELLLECLRQMPTLRLLVSARGQASVRGEWVYELDELAHDTSTTQLSPAARLFAWYAQKQVHDYSLTDQAAFAQLYDLLGGHPLALEMAAAWSHVLALDELADALRSDLSMLERRDAAGEAIALETRFQEVWESLPVEEQAICQAMAQTDQRWFTTTEWLALPGASYPLLLALRDGAWLRRDGEERLALWTLLRSCVRQWGGV